MNDHLAKAQAVPGGYRQPKGPPTLSVEALPGGFVVQTHNGDYAEQPAREVVSNIDALIGAVNRWHRGDARRAEHD